MSSRLHVRRNWYGLAAGLTLVCSASGEAQSKGDHPAFTAMADFNSYTKQSIDFDVVVLRPGEVHQARGTVYSGPLRFEGKITRLRYRGPRGTSMLAIYTNHLNAVRSVGGRALTVRPDRENGCYWDIFELPQGTAPPAHALLQACSAGGYALTVVEPAAMVQTVKASRLAEQLQSTGIATLYIEFDTNDTKLKADGLAAVAEVVALLNQDTALKLSIEGHTDSVGDAKLNQRLSEARAQAVLAAVTAQGIDAVRLSALGHGQDVPVADNRTDEGRAKNRRVELVRRP